MSESLQTIREHIGELKKRGKVVFLSFIALFVIFLAIPVDPSQLLSSTGTYQPFVSLFILRVQHDLLPPGWQLIANHLNEPLEVYLVACLLFALIFNTPITAYETIKFIDPALNEREKKLLYPFVLSVSGLFAFGVVFGYFFLARVLLIALGPFLATVGASPLIDVADFYFVMFLTISMSGFAFTIPVYVYALINFGILRVESFRKNRVIIWAVTYILTAIVTPDGGPLADLILFVPIIALLEIAVYLGGRSRGAKERREATSGGAGQSAGQPPPPPPPTPVCPHCGSPISSSDLFCPSCGKAVE